MDFFKILPDVPGLLNEAADGVKDASDKLNKVVSGETKKIKKVVPGRTKTMFKKLGKFVQSIANDIKKKF